MRMQLNCSGLSRDSRAKRIVRGRPGGERGVRDYFKFSKAPAGTGKCGTLNCQVGKKGQTLTGFLRKYFLRETVSSKGLFFVMTCSQIGSLPHCLTQPKMGSMVQFYCLPPPYLRLLAILEQQPALEWASPLCIIPKKNRTV
jgi:hypothetical protein